MCARSLADPPRLETAGHRAPATLGRRLPSADFGAAHPPLGRPDRDTLPRVRLAGLPVLLPGLARPDQRLRGGRGRSPGARTLVAGVGLRSPERGFLALARARRVGALRGLLPDPLVPEERQRDA